MKKINGVYKITNTVTGDFYIGSSIDIKKRWYEYKSPSQWVQLPKSRLYQDMAKYGKDNFLFEIVEETNNSHCNIIAVALKIYHMLLIFLFIKLLFFLSLFI